MFLLWLPRLLLLLKLLLLLLLVLFIYIPLFIFIMYIYFIHVFSVPWGNLNENKVLQTILNYPSCFRS